MPPTIALVTPTLNAAAFLEETLLSVLGQNCPGLQYVVMDGGSTDGTLDILHRYGRLLHLWESGRDNGNYAAIAAGFAHTQAEIMGWINADDLHFPWTLATVTRIFRDCPEVEWITSDNPVVFNGQGLPIAAAVFPGVCKSGFRGGENIQDNGNRPVSSFIQQEGTFWRRSLWERVGGFDPSFRYAADFDLWNRFFDLAPVHTVPMPLAGFRRHSRSQISLAHRDSYVRECWASLDRSGRTAPDTMGFIARATRMFGVDLPDLRPHLQPLHSVLWDEEQGRFVTRVAPMAKR